MITEGKDGESGMEPGDDEALWRLLGRARHPEASPYFARRVLREVALAGEARGRAADGPVGWLAGLRQTLTGRRMAVWPAVVGVAVFWLSVVLTTNKPAPGRENATVARQEASPESGRGLALAPAASEDVASQDVEVIADLDNLITREENRLWTDDTARF